MKRLVLAGAGHAHALVLRDLARRPLSGTQVVVLSPEPRAPYSGMVPGWLAGLYRFDEIVIDIPPLAAASGAQWVRGSLHALDPLQRRITLEDGSALDYDLLSLNLGSTLEAPAARHAHMLPLRPLALLQERVDTLLARWVRDPSVRPFTVTAVGGGAAGVEGLLALLQRLRRLRPERPVRGALLTRGSSVLPAMADAARRATMQALQRAGVDVQLNSSGWSDAVDQRSDVVVWATGAQAHAWQRDPARRGALAVDEAGFVRVDAQLRSLSHPQVFAAGDCASWPQRALPKAGVHAVRMGPALAHNLRAAAAVAAAEDGSMDPAAAGRAQAGFLRHVPQRQMLALLSTGDGRAIASRGAFAAEGRWAWWWKDWIDRRFLRQFAAGPAAAARATAR